MHLSFLPQPHDSKVAVKAVPTMGNIQRPSEIHPPPPAQAPRGRCQPLTWVECTTGTCFFKSLVAFRPRTTTSAFLNPRLQVNQLEVPLLSWLTICQEGERPVPGLHTEPPLSLHLTY